MSEPDYPRGQILLGEEGGRNFSLSFCAFLYSRWFEVVKKMFPESKENFTLKCLSFWRNETSANFLRFPTLCYFSFRLSEVTNYSWKHIAHLKLWDWVFLLFKWQKHHYPVGNFSE